MGEGRATGFGLKEVKGEDGGRGKGKNTVEFLLYARICFT